MPKHDWGKSEHKELNIPEDNYRSKYLHNLI